MARKRDAASMAYVAGDFLLIKREGGKLEFAEVLAGSGPGMSVQVRIVHGVWIPSERVGDVIRTRGPHAPGDKVQLRHPSSPLGKVVTVVGELGGFRTTGQLGPMTFPFGSVLLSYPALSVIKCLVDPGNIVQVLAHGLKQEKASKRVQQLEWYGGKKWHKVTVHDEASNKRRPEASNRIAKSTWDEASKLNFQQLSPQQVVDRFRAAKEQASKPKFRQLSAQQLIDTFKENSEIVKAPVQESTHADDANPPPDDEVDYYYEKLQEQALADYEGRFA
eukprot:CAMPEP_0198593626 /NCGR_PEP_ID=MMETSP1462-20131121/139630_1 /TAXON_ID=1333877 /ORGANISM="Brandtodinium nutriculum, Strain RCC3387" /LENGTH=276 /DNA_ID=CAMNT_0044325229 /DNA_START=6 /DNA_END=836 /DNA_ORIENTATION=-